MLQRRSRPVNGSVALLDWALGDVLVVGAASFAGALGVLVSGELFSFDGDVPVVGVGAGVVLVLGVGAVWL